MTSPALTDEEKRAIASLKRLARKWPASLWLFSANGTMSVMLKDETGGKAMTDLGGFDPEYAVATVDIETDGGDW